MEAVGLDLCATSFGTLSQISSTSVTILPSLLPKLCLLAPIGFVTLYCNCFPTSLYPLLGYKLPNGKEFPSVLFCVFISSTQDDAQLRMCVQQVSNQ